MGNTVKPFLNISTGDMIRRELEFLGWTQEDLAQVTNISRKTLSNIMNAKQKLQMEHARHWQRHSGEVRNLGCT